MLSNWRKATERPIPACYWVPICPGPTKMIHNRDITVVVQGPVQTWLDRAQDEGITRKCLQSVRRYLPGSPIVLSTWEGQDLDGLEFDELVISDDPGSNIIGYEADGEPMLENTNRQIVSTVAGLRKVGTGYAVKLRADNFLTGTGFLQLQQRFSQRADGMRLTAERVVVNNTFTRKYAKGYPVVFHTCDFFYFGLASDVLDMWDLGLLSDFPYDSSRAGRRQYHGAPAPGIDVMQDLCVRFLNKHLSPPIELRNLHDRAGELAEQCRLFYANNLVIAAPEDIGLGMPSKFSGDARVAKRSSRITFLQFVEWQRLYRRYCDPSVKIDGEFKSLLALWFWRCLLLPTKLTEQRFRAFKAAKRG